MEQFVNYAVTTLIESIDATQTSLRVKNSENFPSIPEFRVLVDRELMLVTEVNGDTWTVKRQIEGTIAQSHTEGSRVAHTLTVGGLRELIRQEIERTLQFPHSLDGIRDNIRQEIGRMVPRQDTQFVPSNRFVTFPEWCDTKSSF